MLDVRRLRTELDAVKAGIVRRGDASLLAELDEIAALDLKQRELAAARDDVRGRIKALSKQVADARRAGDTEKAEALQAESRELGADESHLTDASEHTAANIRRILLGIPNLPAEEAPDGDVDPVLSTGNHQKYGEHQRVPHWDVGAALNILDLDAAVKLSGSMFVMYRGAGARLLRALTALALDRHADAYEEVRPPTLVREETMLSTGHLPKFRDDAYVTQDNLWLIPTAEVPLTSLARDEILDEADLPVRYCAYTPCFRREAGSAGADTRGLLRSHEFDKVELFAYSTPDQASKVHEDILQRAEAIVRDLGLEYRVVDIRANDLGFSNARTWDVEVYAPGVDRWLEVSSVSWYSDFQARRANVRYRPAGAKGTEFVHTCNGSAVAWPRIIAAILETHRQPDGSVAIPDALRPYMGRDRITPP